MAGKNIVGGLFEAKYNGIVISCKGDLTINLGAPKREGQVDSRKTVGFTAKPQVPSIKGMLYKLKGTKVTDITGMTGATVTIKGGDNSRYVFSNTEYTGDGDISMEEGTLQFECQAMSAEQTA